MSICIIAVGHLQDCDKQYSIDGIMIVGSVKIFFHCYNRLQSSFKYMDFFYAMILLWSEFYN